MKLIFTKSSEKDILKIEKKLSIKIADKIKLLSNYPYGLSSEKLEGGKGYRIRIGDYRVVYTIDKGSKTITIIRIRHRKEVYR